MVGWGESPDTHLSIFLFPLYLGSQVPQVLLPHGEACGSPGKAVVPLESTQCGPYPLILDFLITSVIILFDYLSALLFLLLLSPGKRGDLDWALELCPLWIFAPTIPPPGKLCPSPICLALIHLPKLHHHGTSLGASTAPPSELTTPAFLCHSVMYCHTELLGAILTCLCLASCYIIPEIPYSLQPHILFTCLPRVLLKVSSGDQGA